ncbi:RES family NAD+ phosphorylase [Notoacmeibacter ruber]|uniref:RES domain-containing protein n=1 Tax=Notoacmeibacter ruber TaxID=2670375 RepID=A0A3L7J712_9HYPH|nr:RES family NAD+ phosphorylase [Notoacmeibacter ruber]RLQ85231.1 RES domain-containing protein [Notoacmeibacter ruber]
MKLYRLSIAAHSRALDGGYGLLFDGRWNTAGHAVTYMASVPSLCLLEKLVHVEDPVLLPDLDIIVYDVPDDWSITRIEPDDLPPAWTEDEALTQSIGDEWHEARQSPLLSVPSAIIAVAGAEDRNFVVNHSHERAGDITIESVTPFRFDPRLL